MLNRSFCRVILVAGAMATGLALRPEPASTQAAPPPPPATAPRPTGPPPPQNLQFFPKDTPRPEVIRIMRQFSSALGVRCDHCHVNEEGGANPREDFATDEKPAKVKARAMLQMTKQINEELLAKLADRATPAVTVSCVTCHHGLPRPETLAGHLGLAATAGGPDSSVAELRRLREEAEFGRFDVSEWGVNEAARTLSGEGKRAEALALLRANAGYHPESKSIPAIMAEVHVAQGDTAQAVEILRKLVVSDPENRRLKQRLEQLTGPARGANR